jgi:CHAT domain-containing protein
VGAQERLIQEAEELNSQVEELYSQRRYDKAIPLAVRALAISEKALGPEHPETATTLTNLASLYHATGAYAQAEPLYERALVIQEKNTTRFLLSGSEARKQAYLQKLTSDIFAYVSFSISVSGRQAIALGLTSVLHYKGRVLDAMSDNVARLRQSVRPEDRALFEQLAGVAQQLSTLTFQDLGNLPPDTYRRRLDDLAQQHETLEAELATRSAEFRQQLAPISVAAVRQAIPAHAVLVDWFRYRPLEFKAQGETLWGKPRYLTYILKPDGEPVAMDMGDAAAVETLIREFRGAVSDPSRTDVRELATEVFEKLFKPLLPYVGNTEHVLIAPDGALNLVPFAALLDDQGEYVATRFEITYLTSGRDLLRVASASSVRGNPVVVANPAYDASADVVAPGSDVPKATRVAHVDGTVQVFTPLPGTAAEAQALKALLKLPDHQVLTGVHATEAQLKHLHGPRILHVATHGFFLRDQPTAVGALKPVGFAQVQPPVLVIENPLLRSGLALAGANQRRSGTNDDGILTAFEAAQLDLRGTELVILSACETGVGEVQNGEGVYGLRRALVLAGAQTQVTSLWKVADDATKDLMVEYYRGLLKGEGRSGALREVQKAMLASQDRWHPYYWAAFVPIGNWAPLPMAR